MHDHDTSERLASYADVLAGELPDSWSSSHLPADAKDDLAELADRIWIWTWSPVRSPSTRFSRPPS
ncbi:hypothetical protein [Streptomyces stelliscabiei]|uniref:hypothetical protein n=1 Tax=Streptomyces stelliscabiei TaxID=146820 RepID=UPI003A945745